MSDIEYIINRWVRDNKKKRKGKKNENQICRLGGDNYSVIPVNSAEEYFDKALYLEKKYNVFIDLDSLQLNRRGRNETFGWEPIPEEWLEEEMKVWTWKTLSETLCLKNFRSVEWLSIKPRNYSMAASVARICTTG